ncbi:T9SS sorting signal type C domain-containing protein [Flavobacterium sp. ACN6]|uniref:T9SS sorting signal type C domain-containing protein n=1 Tax=Flavobacterium sp. ACN6 TaxID=1920426 RepID=UPI000BB2FD83|nr:T9SS sorting signal type C domain-containing protein [Flavobacterium sp. ACN6]PBJ10953.1 hypothetical protein BSF42_29330 [Flavobacterium sp. ACN6]
MRLKLPLFFIFISIYSWSQTTNTFTSNGSFVVAAGLTSVTAECWGAGGAGGGNDTSNSAGGGGGGGYSKALITVSPNTTINYSVGVGGLGSTASGPNGSATTFSTVSANGGGGGTSGTGGAAGVGGAIGTGTTFSGGKGSNGSLVLTLLYSGGGGSSAGIASNGNNASLGGGGAAVTGGGAGGNGGAVAGPGANGGIPGGGGGGGLVLLGLGNNKGGNGGNGQIKLTYTCPAYNITTTAAGNACVTDGNSSVVLTSSTSLLPAGNYTVTYDRSSPAATGLTAPMTVASAGTGNFTAVGFTAAGTSTITIRSIASGTCSSTISTSSASTASITVFGISVGGSAGGGTTICSGSGSGTLTLSGQTGTVVKWQSSVSPFSTWSDITNSAATTYVSGPLTQTTRFRAVVKNGTCSTADSNYTTVTVNPNPTISTTGTLAAVCQNTLAQPTSLAYTATTNSPISYSIDWQTLTDQGTTAFTFGAGTGSINNINVPANTPSGNYLGVLTILNGNGCFANQNISLTVNALPTITTTGTVTAVCQSASAQPTSLAYTATTNAPINYSIDWQTLTDQGATAFAFGSGAGSINNISVPANTAAGTYNGVMTISTVNGCSRTQAVSLVVNTSPTINTTGVFTSVCQSASAQITTLNYNSTTGSPVNYAIDWVALTDQASTPFPFSSGSGTVINVNVPANTAAGTYNGVMTISTANACPVNQAVSLTINAVSTAPTASVTQQPTCQNNTGIITVTSPASGTGYSYSINGTDFSNTSGVFTGLASGAYNVTTKNISSGCESLSTPLNVNAVVTKMWNGSVSASWGDASNWTPAGVPLASDCVEIPDVAINPIISGTNGSFFANRITIENEGSLIVEGTNTITVTNEVKVFGNGVFNFENNASLVQVSNAVNTGNITYKRDSKPLRFFDLTHWSSPVTRVPALTLYSFSPGTLWDKYFKYDPVAKWVTVYNGTEEMIKGVGYSIRSPQSFDLSIPQIFHAEFVGVPNNGDILGPAAVAEKFTFFGNPYPSAIYADQFIYDNTANIYGTLFFWTHNSLPSQSVPGDNRFYYSDNDYAIYNLSGSTSIGNMVGTGAPTPGNQDPPSGYIAAGQGFFAKARTTQSVLFTNSMRVPGRNSQFYKSTQANVIEKHRVWLNMTNTQGAFKQLLIAYVTGATNLWDNNYDAVSMDAHPYIDFFSINQNKKLVIQGREVPFVASDTIPLGYRSALEGEFTIAIDHTDGNLDDQVVYLQDNVTKKLHNLKSGGYTFTTTIGLFPSRFVLRYTDPSGTLGNEDFTGLEQYVFVSVKDKNIKLQSTSDEEKLQETAVYDIGGKLLYHKTGIDNKEWLITNLHSGPQVLLVKITLDNGKVITRKVIFN